jgi:hypothetical protein
MNEENCWGIPVLYMITDIFYLSQSQYHSSFLFHDLSPDFNMTNTTSATLPEHTEFTFRF